MKAAINIIMQIFCFPFSTVNTVNKLLDPVLRIYLTFWEAAKLFTKAVVLFGVSLFMHKCSDTCRQ